MEELRNQTNDEFVERLEREMMSWREYPRELVRWQEHPREMALWQEQHRQAGTWGNILANLLF